MQQEEKIQKIIDRIYSDNIGKTEKYQKEGKLKPKVAIIMTSDNEASKIYVNSKTKKQKEYGIDNVIVYFDSNLIGEELEIELRAKIKELNNDETITSIILQLPLHKSIVGKTQEMLNLISHKKDVDRLSSIWSFCKESKNLPLTAFGIYKVIEKLSKTNHIGKVLFLGNGITTNRSLFPFMFNEGKFECSIVNSKTSGMTKEKLIKQAELIIAATGIPESLECIGKYIISPTIAKTENGHKSDLKDYYRRFNNVHKVLNGIGKLTVSEMLLRSYEDCE